MKTTVIIQARMGSSRLPGKVLKKLGETVVLDYVVERCRNISGVDDVIVATSTKVQDNSIEHWCIKSDIPCFRGSEDDVLSRYYECAKHYNSEIVIRVTADCPFVDYQLASLAIERIKDRSADQVKVVGELPRGLTVGVISFKALEYINEYGKEERHREHVTYYATEYPEEFNVQTIEAPIYLNQPDLRITLDTEDDYKLLQAVADKFKGDILVNTEQVINYLIKNPSIAKVNAHVKQKPVT